MTYLRQFAPAVLRAVRFAGGPGTDELLAAVAMLAELYATGARKVPAGAPVGFVPTKWAGYLAAAAEAGDITAYRRYWEIAVLVGLRDGLRSGDVFVPGSRRYADPASFLLTPGAWAPQKVEFCHLVGKPAEAADALAHADDELHTALADLETQLAKGNPGEVRLTDDGELIIPPLTAEDVPGEADALRTELAQMLPRVPIASVLVELDARTGFTDHLVHAGGKVNRPAELKRNLLYVIIAEATNMGLSAMAESCGVPPRRRSRTTCSTGCWATRPTCRPSSTPPTPTAPPLCGQVSKAADSWARETRPSWSSLTTASFDLITEASHPTSQE